MSPQLMQNPLCPGVSAAGHGCGAGTFGAWVRDGNGRRYLLSAWHVFVGRNGAAGHLVFQQSPDDGGVDPGHVVGRVVNFVRNAAGDAAIAVPVGHRVVSNKVFAHQITLRGTRDPKVHDVLHKFGRTTMLTRGVVTRVGVVQTTYLAACLGFELKPHPMDPPGALTSPGDSGAIWFDLATGKGVGMHLEGEAHGMPQRAIAGRLSTALNALRVTL